MNPVLKKYQLYVSNIEWHIKTNRPTGNDLEKCENQLDCYREIVADLTPTILPVDVQEQARAYTDERVFKVDTIHEVSGLNYWTDIFNAFLAGAAGREGWRRIEDSISELISDMRTRRISHAKKKQESMDSYQDQYCHGRIDECDYIIRRLTDLKQKNYPTHQINNKEK